jgi:hypothetical protein
MAGLILLLLGIQFYYVDTIELTPEFTQFLAKQTGHPLAAVGAAAPAMTLVDQPAAKGRRIQPPEWIGWALMSLGSVLVLHSWAMPRPAG